MAWSCFCSCTFVFLWLCGRVFVVVWLCFCVGVVVFAWLCFCGVLLCFCGVFVAEESCRQVLEKSVVEASRAVL